MYLSSIVEKWDSLLYFFYNCFIFIKWPLFDFWKYKSIVKNNKLIKNKYNGERCFILLNGPSIMNHDLSYLRNEYVFATNYFYKTDLAKQIIPNCFCILDSKSFKNDSGLVIKNEIRSIFPDSIMMLNIKAFNKKDECNIYYSYNKHMPYYKTVKNNFNGICSGFSNVSCYVVNLAIYMGFKEIYILGMDFEPAGFKHFSDKCGNCFDPRKSEDKNRVLCDYWEYAKAHQESYAISNYARKKGVKVVNLNSNSYIRAYDFDEYESIILKGANNDEFQK